MDKNKSKDDGILLRQKHFNMTFFSIWIMLITTIQWIMLDMYLPALPVLTRQFHVSESLLNVSLNSGILFVAIGTLISGVISDRYGRKTILLAGFAMNIAGSFACAAAGGVMTLIIMRGLQGLGGGFVLTVTTAMIKDSLTGRRFQTTMTVLQSIAAVGPIFAPAMGSFLINLSSWRMIFIFLGAAALITMLPMIISTDTLPKDLREGLSMRQVLAGARDMMKSKKFVLFLTIMAVLEIPAWAYVGVSSYIFIDEFGLSNMAYGRFYSLGAMTSCLAPFIYLLLTRKLSMHKVVAAAIFAMLLGGVLMLTGGRLSPVFFIAAVLPVLLSEGIIRPLGYVVLLEEFKDAAGTVSSWTHFVLNAVGIVGTSIATLQWSSMITALIILSLACGMIGVACLAGLVRTDHGR